MALLYWASTSCYNNADVWVSMYSEAYRRRLRREDAPSIIDAALGRSVSEEDTTPLSAGSGGAPNEDEATKTMEIVGTEPVGDQDHSSKVGTMLPISAAGTREETSPASAVGAADRVHVCDHRRIPQEQDPPPAEEVEENVRTASVPIDVDTCIPWEQFDVKFGKLDTVDTFKTSSETSPGNEEGDGWADESMPLAANDSRWSRCKSWAKLLTVFALGAVLGGVLVAHTPLGGGGSQTPAAVSSSTSTSSEYEGAAGADQQEGLAENSEGGETPNLASLANQNDNSANSSRPEKEADESPDGYFGQNDGGMLDFLHDTFEEIIPIGESDSISPGDSAPPVDILPDDDRDEEEGGDKFGIVEEEMILPMDKSKTMDDSIDDATSNTTSAIDDDDDDDLTYVPGELSQLKKGLLLSRGLDVAIIAQSDRPVVFANGTHSKLNFHGNPDFGATFAYPDDDQSNPGGYVYVSNAEIKHSEGGVGALTFDKNGGIIDYKMLLQGTSMNCGGGRTFWNTWISCEEKTGDRSGQIYQVDPFDRRPPEQTVLGKTGGAFESFAYRLRQGSSKPRFFVTEDDMRGSLRRFTPARKSLNMSEPWSMLHGEGQLDYLLLWPNKGTYGWTQDKARADLNARKNYQQTEGIDVKGNRLYFVSKEQHELFILNLDSDTYEVESTISGVFDGSPDQLVRLVGDGELLYYTEEGGRSAGIHARDNQGRYFTILESPVYQEETTGLAFSPDHKHMYLAYQKNGILLDVWRRDGSSFSGRDINIKYHTGIV